MATEPESEHPAGKRSMRQTPCSDEHWQRMWSHREHLLKVARRRSMSAEDAEDAVHEAMLRAMERPHLDGDRIGAWLTTVTIRLCVDRHRQVNREVEVGSRTTLAAPAPPPIDEEICDRAEADWLALRSDELPARQAEALWLKSYDLDVDQVARKMGLSYRTVESLLARARRTLRNSLAGTLVLVVWLCGRGRPRTGGGAAQSVAAVSTAATLAVLGLALPGVYDGTAPRPRQAVPERGAEWPAERHGSGAPWSAPTGAVAGRPPVGPVVGGVELPAVSLTVLSALPRLPLAAGPEIPRIPGLSPPRLPGPAAGLPVTPDVPPLPDTPKAPDTPETPDVPKTPDASDGDRIPDAPDVSGGRHGSGTPDVPDAGQVPDAPYGGSDSPLPDAPGTDGETASRAPGNLDSDLVQP